MKNDQVQTSRYVVSDGLRYLGHDSASGGYPWVSDSIHNATIYNDIEKAIEGADDFLDLCRMPFANVYQIVLQPVNIGPAIENMQKRRREAELARIKQNVSKLRPEDIEYIKKNM